MGICEEYLGGVVSTDFGESKTWVLILVQQLIAIYLIFSESRICLNFSSLTGKIKHAKYLAQSMVN